MNKRAMLHTLAQFEKPFLGLKGDKYLGRQGPQGALG